MSDDMTPTQIDWSTPFDEWLIPLLNRARYCRAIEFRAIPSAIQKNMEAYVTVETNNSLEQLKNKLLGNDPDVIQFTSSKWNAGNVNRNDPLYFAIHRELSDVSTWVKNGGVLDLPTIDRSAMNIIRAARMELKAQLSADLPGKGK